MPTIAEILAARQNKAAAPAEPAPGRPVARTTSPVLRAADDKPAAPVELEDPTLPNWLTNPRSLSGVKGEQIPMTPPTPDAETAAWYASLQAFETELCAMRHPEDPEAVWLAIRHIDKPQMPPVLLHRLPWLLYDHPAAATEEEPY